MSGLLLPADILLYQPYEEEQILLAEQASSLSVKTFLKMCHLPYQVEFRANAELMSPGGHFTKLPFLRVGNDLISEFRPIASFVLQRNSNMDSKLEENSQADIRSYVSLVDKIFTMAELYVSFVDETVYSRMTKQRYGIAFPWPLNLFMCYQKRRSVLSLLKQFDWHSICIEEVVQNVTRCCETLTLKITAHRSPYFYTEGPTELDAIVFGHLFTVLTTELPNMALAHTVCKFKPLLMFCAFVENSYFGHELRSFRRKHEDEQWGDSERDEDGVIVN